MRVSRFSAANLKRCDQTDHDLLVLETSTHLVDLQLGPIHFELQQPNWTADAGVGM
jgi:hypothetical protein